MKLATIALGSNLGNRVGNLARALAFLSRDPRIKILKISSLYRTAPVGTRPQPDYVNAVAKIRTAMSAPELLRCLQRVESKLGRVRLGKNKPRVVDLDILEHGRSKVKKSGLIVPHPRMLGRRFVLEPLAEIDPGKVLLANHRPVRRMLAKRRISAQRLQRISEATLSLIGR